MSCMHKYFWGFTRLGNLKLLLVFPYLNWMQRTHRTPHRTNTHAKSDFDKPYENLKEKRKHAKKKHMNTAENN